MDIYYGYLLWIFITGIYWGFDEICLTTINSLQKHFELYYSGGKKIRSNSGLVRDHGKRGKENRASPTDRISTQFLFPSRAESALLHF